MVSFNLTTFMEVVTVWLGLSTLFTLSIWQQQLIVIYLGAIWYIKHKCTSWLSISLRLEVKHDTLSHVTFANTHGIECTWNPANFWWASNPQKQKTVKVLNLWHPQNYMPWKLYLHGILFYLHTLIMYIYLVQAEITTQLISMQENEINPVTFSCQAIGEPVPVIIWYFDCVIINI